MPQSSTTESPHSGLIDAFEALKAGEQSALHEIYRLTNAKLFGICLRILNDHAEAEDALQDVYVSLWRSAGSFDASRASPISWLSTFARNRAIDRLRSSRRLRDAIPIEEAQDHADEHPSAFALMSADEDRQRLHGCMDELNADQRETICAAFFQGFTYSQLAERAAKPLGTMKSWIRRGLQQLKDCLER